MNTLTIRDLRARPVTAPLVFSISGPVRVAGYRLLAFHP